MARILHISRYKATLSSSKMKKVIIGLGNPGKEYQNSRHNLGFMFLDYLQEVLELGQFVYKKKLMAMVLLSSHLILVKPQTFMNKSGEAVRKTLVYYLQPEELSCFAAGDSLVANNNLIVVHDDLDLSLGQFKVQRAVGPRQHNGLLSIYQALGSSHFWHVRLGIDDRLGDRTTPSDRYVLQSLPTDFKTNRADLFSQVFQKMKKLGLVELEQPT